MMPSSCASDSASHTCIIISASRPNASGPSRRKIAPRSSPLHSSMTRYIDPPDSPKSNTCTVFGDDSRDTASASRRKRCATSRSCVSDACSTFIAAILPIARCSTL